MMDASSTKTMAGVERNALFLDGYLPGKRQPVPKRASPLCPLQATALSKTHNFSFHDRHVTLAATRRGARAGEW
jgi:hypothetical protein